MSLKDFSNIYNNYVNTPEKKVYAEQIDKQLKTKISKRKTREHKNHSQRKST